MLPKVGSRYHYTSSLENVQLHQKNRSEIVEIVKLEQVVEPEVAPGTWIHVRFEDGQVMRSHSDVWATREQHKLVKLIS